MSDLEKLKALKFHKSASHVSPDYRDAWNHAIDAGIAAVDHTAHDLEMVQPVAWLADQWAPPMDGCDSEGDYIRVSTTYNPSGWDGFKNAVPLYTHPQSQPVALVRQLVDALRDAYNSVDLPPSLENPVYAAIEAGRGWLESVGQNEINRSAK